MELNRKVLVKVAVILFLLGITATVEARFDARSFVKEVLPKADANYFVKSTTAGIHCACTASWPISICSCPGKECQPPCSGVCVCELNLIEDTKKCYCALETMFFPGAGAHEVK